MLLCCFYRLGNAVTLLMVHPSVHLLKHIVRCYLCLADHPRAHEALKTCLPSSLKDGTFGPHLHNDPAVQKWLSQLLSIVGEAENTGGNGSNPLLAGQPGTPGTDRS
jgi:CCR4-NOT transcription complex subunit 9